MYQETLAIFVSTLHSAKGYCSGRLPRIVQGECVNPGVRDRLRAATEQRIAGSFAGAACSHMSYPDE